MADKRVEEVYNHLKHIEGVNKIDGRTSFTLHYTGNVATCEKVVDALTDVYGEPDDWHPMLDYIGWKQDTFSIHVRKAASETGGSTYVAINILPK